MHLFSHRITRLLTTFCVIAVVLFGATAPLSAKPVELAEKAIKFPKRTPTFSFQIPEGWTSEFDDDGDIECTSDDGSDFSFTIMKAKEIESVKQLKEFLPKMAKEVASGAKLKKIKVGEMVEGKSPDGISMAVLEASGKVETETLIITLMGFTTARGKYYVLMTCAQAEVDKAHQKAMGAIVDSIKKVE